MRSTPSPNYGSMDKAEHAFVEMQQPLRDVDDAQNDAQHHEQEVPIQDALLQPVEEDDAEDALIAVPNMEQNDNQKKKVDSPYLQFSEWIGQSSLLQRSLYICCFRHQINRNYGVNQRLLGQAKKRFTRSDGLLVDSNKLSRAYCISGFLAGSGFVIHGAWRLFITGLTLNDVNTFNTDPINSFHNTIGQILIGTSNKQATLSSFWQYQTWWPIVWLGFPIFIGSLNAWRYSRFAQQQQLRIADEMVAEQEMLTVTARDSYSIKTYLVDHYRAANELSQIRAALRFDENFTVEKRQQLLKQIQKDYLKYPWWVRLDLLLTLRVMANAFNRLDDPLQQDQTLQPILIFQQNEAQPALEQLIQKDKRVIQYTYGQYQAWRADLSQSKFTQGSNSIFSFIGSLFTGRYLLSFYHFLANLTQSKKQPVCADWDEIDPVNAQTAQGCFQDLFKTPHTPEFLTMAVKRLGQYMQFEQLDLSLQTWTKWTLTQAQDFFNAFRAAAPNLQIIDLSCTVQSTFSPEPAIIDLIAQLISSHPVRKISIRNQNIASPLLLRSAFPSTVEEIDLSNTNIEDDDIPMLQPVLAFVKKVNLSGNQFTDPGFQQITTTLTQSNNTVTDLDISQNDNLSEASLIPFGTQLDQTKIEKLNISYIYVSPAICDAIGSGLRGSRVTMLIASGCNMKTSGANQLLPHVVHSPVQILDVGNNELKDDISDAVVDLLNLSNVTDLRLAQNDLTSNFLNDTKEACQNSTLISIALSGNPFRDSALADFINHFPLTLQSFHAANTNAGNETLAAFDSFVSNNYVFKEINLASNQFTSQQATRLFLSIKHRTAVTRVILDNNQVTGIEVTAALVDVIQQLEYLSLINCQFSDDEVQMISPQLATSPLKIFLLDQNENITDQGGEALTKGLVKTPFPNLLFQPNLNSDEQAVLQDSHTVSQVSELSLNDDKLTAASALGLCRVEAIAIQTAQVLSVSTKGNPIDLNLDQKACRTLQTSAAAPTRKPLFIFKWLSDGVEYMRQYFKNSFFRSISTTSIKSTVPLTPSHNVIAAALYEPQIQRIGYPKVKHTSNSSRNIANQSSVLYGHANFITNALTAIIGLALLYIIISRFSNKSYTSNTVGAKHQRYIARIKPQIEKNQKQQSPKQNRKGR